LLLKAGEYFGLRSLYVLGEGWCANQSHEQQCQALAHSPFSAASLGIFGAKGFLPQWPILQ
jgi:hypothetical protein